MQKVFGPTPQRSRKSLLHHVQPCFAGVQPQVARVQEAFHSLSSKRPCAPSPNHFREFPYFRPLSQALWFATLDFEPRRLMVVLPALGAVWTSLCLLICLKRSTQIDPLSENSHEIGDYPGNPNHQYFLKALQYKQEAYCDTNRRRYCDTNGRHTAIQI